MTQYDQTYREAHYFGNPYAGLMAFFRESERGTLVDLGAGQGRDSIPLAGMGYTVTAVDGSAVGLGQIRQANPGIQTVTGDLYTYDISPYDYVLMDSIVHFYKRDREKETALVRRILTQMKPGAVFVNCLLRNQAAERTLQDIVESVPVDIVRDAYTEYPEFHAEYHLLAVRKRM